jgi:hypothetical protein
MFKQIKTAEDLEQEALDAENAQKVSEAKSYLASSDFYYARKLETGEEVPPGVVEKRKQYRLYIRENEKPLLYQSKE